jgi:diphthamide synthase (EF-2-diphthine--ammonia ligase)
VKRVLIGWSSGKDGAWTLHRLRGMPEVTITGLFTTVTAGSGRVAVHAVREELVEGQARAAGLPLHRIALPDPCPNAVYEAALERFFASQEATHAAFGDLFLEDIRRYRERQFEALDLDLLFPLWGEPTRMLAEEMVAGGLRAWITCVDTRQAPREPCRLRRSVPGGHPPLPRASV